MSSSSSKEKVTCGYCNKPLSNKDVEADYKNECSLCKVTYVLKTGCASTLYQEASDKEKKIKYKNIDKEVWDQTDVGLHCINCKENCFYCGVMHNKSGK